MYVKIILGTKLSFFGYKKDENVFIECYNADDFIKNINLLDINKKYYKKARNLYCNYYSNEKSIHYYKPIYEFLNKY
jgi:hypothetical protein